MRFAGGIAPICSIFISIIARHYIPLNLQTSKRSCKLFSMVEQLDLAGPIPEQRNYRQEAAEVLGFLNFKTGRNYRLVDTNLDFIVGRLKSGVTVQQCKTVIARKHRQWGTNEKMWD